MSDLCSSTQNFNLPHVVGWNAVTEKFDDRCFYCGEKCGYTNPFVFPTNESQL